MTRKRDRIFALFGAALFFATAIALSVAVIWQMSRGGDTGTGAASTSQSSAGTKLSNFTPVSEVTQLQSTDTKVGTGQEAKAGDTVTVDYTGAIASNGVIFQSSKDSGAPVSLDLNNVIEGWKEGIPGMKVGGTRRLVIPAALAYGENPPSGSGIPANAALVFDITLDSIGGKTSK
ncbi:MAG TPA: FKBP-type peptidyl-prolyl cis-trans isomerase [Candidatus Saccharimonadales bacterium]|nr:FKBP-type peptidyl-prolyl cis-trans isomerase [Candidatus Saccharimonadales bacterium]